MTTDPLTASIGFARSQRPNSSRALHGGGKQQCYYTAQLEKQGHAAACAKSRLRQFQNISRKANWISRGSLAAVTVPKLPLEIPCERSLKLGWFSTLKNSARNW